MKSRWTIDLNVRGKIMKFQNKNVRFLLTLKKKRFLKQNTKGTDKKKKLH